MNKRKIFLILLTMVLTVAMTAGTFDVFGETAATGSSSATATATDAVSAVSSTSTSTASGSLASKTAAASDTTGTGDKIATVDKNDSYKSGEVLVIFKDTVSDKTAAKVADSADGDIASTTDIGSGSDEKTMAVVETGNDQTVEEAMSACAESGKVEYVQPNYVYETNDGAETKSVIDNDDSTLWHLGKINTDGAWNLLSKIHSKVKVAVLDTGVNTSHEDLQTNLDKDLCVDAAVTNAETPYTDLPKITEDPDGHGTHVTGIIGATANNTASTAAGVASGASNDVLDLFTVDVFDGNEAYTSDIIRGIQYSTWKGAKVINMSLGYDAGSEKDSDDIALENAINDAVNGGTVVTCAAGNDGDTEMDYPAALDSCISVINTVDYSNTTDICKAGGATYGSTCDISAPGTSIYSTLRNGSYGSKSGSSMASPVVAGVAAMLFSIDPDLTVDEVKTILYSTATDLNTTGFDDETASGNVNAYRAVKAVADPAKGNGVENLTANTDSSFVTILSWDYVPGAQTYQIYRSVTGEDGTYEKLDDVAGTSFTDSSTQKGAAYAYKVRAKMDEETYGEWSDVISVSIPMEKMGTLSVKNSGSDISLEWGTSPDADGYYIYMSEGADDNYKKIAEISGGTSTTYVYKEAVAGQTYYFKALPYTEKDGNVARGDESNKVDIKMAFAAPTASASPYTYNSTKITWNSVSGAAGYRVYRYNSSTKKYELRASTGSTAYTDTGLATGTKYYYKVQAYNSVATSGESAVVSARPRLSATKLKLAAGKKKMTLKWKKVSGASGYKIYRAAKKKGKYKKVATIKKGKTVKWTNKKLKKKKKYYYKIKAYRKVSGKLVYSTYSYASRRTR
ncbi:MAG: S8 family serine peptidase [Eubacteriaceae bacterium]|nr:S8 family serine peptidase [Eubacteriaceae bacterium]